MPEKPYSKREIDTLHAHTNESIELLHQKVDAGFTDVTNRLDYTNGKIKKIIIALVFAFGLIIGLGGTNFTSVLKILF